MINCVVNNTEREILRLETNEFRLNNRLSP